MIRTAQRVGFPLRRERPPLAFVGPSIIPLEGTTTLAFALNGEATRRRGLVGPTSLTFALTGDLMGGAIIELEGGTTLTFTPAGELKIGGPLKGSTSITFKLTGRLAGDLFGFRFRSRGNLNTGRNRIGV